MIGAIAFLVVAVLVVRTCSAPQARAKVLYDQHCGSCHGAHGEGFRMYPPLAAPDYLEQHREEFACIVFYGIRDTLVVNGETYTGIMPGNPQLSETDIANIANYVYNQWGNPGGTFTATSIARDLENCPPKP